MTLHASLTELIGEGEHAHRVPVGVFSDAMLVAIEVGNTVNPVTERLAHCELKAKVQAILKTKFHSST